MMQITEKIHKTEGFSLIELLVAVCVIAIAFAGLASMQIACINGNSIASNLTTGITLAQDKMEELKSLNVDESELGDNNTSNNADLLEGTKDSTVVGNTTDADDGHREENIDEEGNAGGMYTRIWNIADNTPINGRKTVMVIVTWKSHRVSVSSVIGAPYS